MRASPSRAAPTAGSRPNRRERPAAAIPIAAATAAEPRRRASRLTWKHRITSGPGGGSSDQNQAQPHAFGRRPLHPDAEPREAGPDSDDDDREKHPQSLFGSAGSLADSEQGGGGAGHGCVFGLPG